MIDPATLKIGQRVRIWMTGIIGEFTADVTDKKSRGWPVLRLVDEPNSPPLKADDYIVQEVITDA